jgi:hypothetical protein
MVSPPISPSVFPNVTAALLGVLFILPDGSRVNATKACSRSLTQAGPVPRTHNRRLHSVVRNLFRAIGRAEVRSPS